MTLEQWTTAGHRPSARFDAWRRALNRSHLEWALSPPTEPAFHARVRQRMVDGVRVVDCHCDPCTGWRRPPQIAHSDGAYFGILFELRGREVIRQDDREARLAPGDFVLWDSERAMEFRVLAPLHKLTLLVPKPRMQAVLGDAARYAGAVVPGSVPAGAMAADVLRRLARGISTIEDDAAAAVIDPVLGLLAAALMANHPASQPSPGHAESFRRVCHDIERSLGELTLTPSRLAAAHGVSLRYLHLVFAEQGTSVAGWIRQRRLWHCRRELLQPGRGRTITEIAFRWGFNDMAHFSRAFKAQYGVAPRDLRRTGGSDISGGR